MDDNNAVTARGYPAGAEEAAYGDLACRWSAGLSEYYRALATYFERLSEYQLESGNLLARMAADPSRAPEIYATYTARLAQMYGELQAAMQKIMADAQQLFESVQRDAVGQLAAPGNSGLGAVLAPPMKYGQPRSANLSGPGDWRFDPAQGLPLMDTSSGVPDLATSAPASTWPCAISVPIFPAIPSLAKMPALNIARAPASTASPSDFTLDQDVLSARAELRQSMVSPEPSIPPSPQFGYPVPSTSETALSGIKYRCDGYRRVVRAKP